MMNEEARQAVPVAGSCAATIERLSQSAAEYQFNQVLVIPGVAKPVILDDKDFSGVRVEFGGRHFYKIKVKGMYLIVTIQGGNKRVLKNLEQSFGTIRPT